MTSQDNTYTWKRVRGRWRKFLIRNGQNSQEEGDYYVQERSAAWAPRGLFLEKKTVLLKMNFMCERLCTGNILHLTF